MFNGRPEPRIAINETGGTEGHEEAAAMENGGSRAESSATAPGASTTNWKLWWTDL